MHFETILRNVTVCELTPSRLDDFSDIDTVILTIFFGGSWAFFYGEGGGSYCPSNTLDRTLVG